MRWAITALAVAAALAATRSAAADVYPPTPDWISADPHYSTGAALVDLDRDGWLDIVVADGNDMNPGRLNVYYNQGDGTFPVHADWQSSDSAFNGHLDVADVDGDGWMDVAVAHLGTGSVTAPVAKLYMNHAGTLSSTPAWSASVTGNAFGVAFGDVDGDGRPDLAVGTGWAYSPQRFYHSFVFRNVDGALTTAPSWTSGDMNHYQGVLWADADDDGRLDLVAIGADAETQIYHNLGGALETIASWSTTDSANQDGIMVTCGDVTGDGVRDLLATDNTQIGGSGRFKLYAGMDDGLFETTWSWSFYDGYGSAVALADVDADGRLDLATGAWWDHTRIFLNDGSGLPGTPSWSSGGTSVVEKIVFGDVAPACGRELVATERFEPDGDRTLFHLSQMPVQGLVAVSRDGVLLGPDEHTWSREHGWISVSAPPVEALAVTYTWSRALDMVVSNWDSAIGNHLYYATRFDDCNENGVADGCDVASGESPDIDGDGVPDECQCLGDVDGSGIVDFADLLAILARWGPSCAGCPEDVDGDGVVAFPDLLHVLSGWGPC
jgi:hypothetical protein